MEARTITDGMHLRVDQDLAFHLEDALMEAINDINSSVDHYIRKLSISSRFNLRSKLTQVQQSLQQQRCISSRSQDTIPLPQPPIDRVTETTVRLVDRNDRAIFSKVDEQILYVDIHAGVGLPEYIICFVGGTDAVLRCFATCRGILASELGDSPLLGVASWLFASTQ